MPQTLFWETNGVIAHIANVISDDLGQASSLSSLRFPPFLLYCKRSICLQTSISLVFFWHFHSYLLHLYTIFIINLHFFWKLIWLFKLILGVRFVIYIHIYFYFMFIVAGTSICYVPIAFVVMIHLVNGQFSNLFI